MRLSRAIPVLAGASLLGLGMLAMPATSAHTQTTRVSGGEGCGDARQSSYPVVGGLVLAGYVLYSRGNRHSTAGRKHKPPPMTELAHVTKPARFTGGPGHRSADHSRAYFTPAPSQWTVAPMQP